MHPGDNSVRVEIVDASIPEPDAGDVLIKVAVSGSNPKDWYVDPTLIEMTYIRADVK